MRVPPLARQRPEVLVFSEDVTVFGLLKLMIDQVVEGVEVAADQVGDPEPLQAPPSFFCRYDQAIATL